MPGINVLDHAGLYVEQLKDLAESIKIKLEDDSQYLLFSPEEIARTKEKPTQNITEDDYKVNLKNLKEEQRVVSGVHDIYGSLFDELGYKNVIKNPERNDASVDMLEEDFGISMDLNRVYQMMDRLDTTAIDKLKRSGV